MQVFRWHRRHRGRRRDVGVSGPPPCRPRRRRSFPVRRLHRIHRAVARVEPVKPKPPSPPTPSVVHLSRRVPAMIWQSADQPRRQPARVTRSSTMKWDRRPSAALRYFFFRRFVFFAVFFAAAFLFFAIAALL